MSLRESESLWWQWKNIVELLALYAKIAENENHLLRGRQYEFRKRHLA